MADETVLVIEDNELNMKLARSLLQIGKYHVLDARDAETGIEKARKHQPELILMDIQLPGMDGLSAARIIKEDPAIKHIPVVALTSYAMQGDDQKAIGAGFDGYLTKPIDTRAFLKTISQFFGKVPSELQPQEEQEVRHKARVLIVDDEPRNVKLLAAKLHKDKYEILEAYSGEDALGKVNRTPPDLILLDIMMPDIDGYEVTRRLKNDPDTAHIPIILVTALNGSEDKVKGLEAGAEEFLSKPVYTAELLARINSMLRLKQYQEQLIIRTQSDEHFNGKATQEGMHKEVKTHQKVLLVEDDEKDIELIQDLLKAQPWQIIVAMSGEDAISFALKEKIDLVLLDILLPEMDGFEVCHRLKKMDETKDIPIVMITSLSDFETKIKCVEEGADDFLIKPLNRREIIARVKVLLKKKEYLDKLHSHYETAFNSSITDGLTGLYNHAYFKRFLELEVERSIRQGYPIALIMVDFDDFKKYNDTLGHMTGDVILRESAHVIRENVREIDLVARYGGEEFAVVMPYVDRKDARAIAKKIWKTISSQTFLHNTSSPVGKVTASLGVAFCPSDASSLGELIQKADSMLYQAKQKGKNRVCVFSRDL